MSITAAPQELVYRTTDARLTPATIIEDAQRRAAQLPNLPREEVMQRLTHTLDTIRHEAITNGTAIDGDWEGD